ncbi:MAG: helix-turn-helix transcriptional regulator [Clostridia bacterium]|nr:helix-turn-helix transcriptional regulator [Clostridia bacterium]
MILSEKIMTLRRRNGWSQEELAERLDVSRQSVSKWEMGQSVPELDKIVQMSNLFGVSTDTLLRDGIDLDDFAAQTPSYDEGEPKAEEQKPREEQTGNSLNEGDVKNLLSGARRKNVCVAFGVSFCILSPIPLVMGHILFGLIFLFSMVAGAVALFLVSDHIWKSIPHSTYTKGDRLSADAAAYVRGNARAAARRFLVFDLLGVILFILSPIPLLITALTTDGKMTFMTAGTGVAILLGVVAFGVFLILLSYPENTIWERFRAILENRIPKSIRDGEEPRDARERENDANHPFRRIFWSLTTAIYLLVSFLTSYWQYTWLIWPVAAMLFASVDAIWNYLHREEKY